MSGKVKEYNSWVKMMQKLPEEKRQEWVERIHKSIEEQAEKENPTNREELSNFSELLQDGRKFKLVGFAPNAQYIKDSKGKNDPGVLESVYIHAFGTPKLLYAHKKLPILIIVGPDLRMDESVLDEGSNKYKNERHDIKGITG